MLKQDKLKCSFGRWLLCFAILLGGVTAANAQMRVGGNMRPDDGAILDLNPTGGGSVSDRGLLLPRVQLSATNLAAPLAAHAKGMYVYNVAAAGSGATAVTEGIYINDGTQWVKVLVSGNIAIGDLPAEFIVNLGDKLVQNSTFVTDMGDSIAFYFRQTDLGDTIVSYVTNNATQELTDAIMEKVTISSADGTVDIKRSASAPSVIDLAVQTDVVGELLAGDQTFVTNMGDSIAHLIEQTVLGDTIMQYIARNLNNAPISFGDTIIKYIAENLTTTTVNLGDTIIQNLLYDDTTLKALIDSLLSKTNVVDTLFNEITYDDSKLQALIDSLLSKTNTVDTIFNTITYDDSKLQALIDSLLSKTNTVDTIFNTITYDDSKLQALIDSLLKKTNTVDTIFNEISLLKKTNTVDTIFNEIAYDDSKLQALIDSLLKKTNTVDTIFNEIAYDDSKLQALVDSLLKKTNLQDTLVKQLTIPLNEVITTQSKVFNGITSAAGGKVKISSIEPRLTGDVLMRSAFLKVNTLATLNGNAIEWSVAIENDNISSARTCTLDSVVITYICDDDLTAGTVTSEVIVGR